MSHRDALLAAAKRSLLEKGSIRLTARDLTAASGANLASIGYHFGSKDELLSQALVELTGDWAAALEQGLADVPAGDFAAAWDRALGLFTTYRGLWIATLEALTAGSATLRDHLEGVQEEGKRGLAELFELPPATGGALQALLLGSMAQQVIDPDGAPTGTELAQALALIARPG